MADKSEIRAHYTPESRAALEAYDEEVRRWRQRRRRRFVAALTLAAVACIPVAVATYGILPLYALGLAVFYGPWGWELDGSLSRKSTAEKIGGK